MESRSIRDEVAIKICVQAFASAKNLGVLTDKEYSDLMKFVGKYSYDVADALIVARGKGE